MIRMASDALSKIGNKGEARSLGKTSTVRLRAQFQMDGLIV
jgi:hypothetical protein